MKQDKWLLIPKVLICLILVGAVVFMAVMGMDVPETLKIMAVTAIGYLYSQRSDEKLT